MSSTCQKPKSDNNLLVKYWQLKNAEISLAEWEPFLTITWEPDFSQARSFCRMLINHKNFHFTQIPDKTNDMIFLKSPKPCFWAIFDHSLPDGNFFQKIRLCHTQLYMDPLHHVNFQKNLMSQSRENLRTDGRTDRQTLFYRTFRPRPESNKVTYSG